VRVLRGEELDADPIERDEPRGRVRHPLAPQHRHEPGEEPDPQPTRQRGTVGAAVLHEARAHDEVRLSSFERGEQLPELGGVVLAVPVEPDRGVVALLEREAEPGLDGAADADVERQPEHGRAALGGGGPGLVGRGVVDDHDLDSRIEGADLVDDPPDRARLVVRRDDGRDPSKAQTGTPALRPMSSSRRRARCAYVCSSRTRSRARFPMSAACPGSARSSR
jgi:hypothetical protein